MTANAESPNRPPDSSSDREMDEALSWFDDMRKVGGSVTANPPSNPKPLTPNRSPASNLPAWMRRDMARVRALTQNQPATDALPDAESDRLDWFDSYATDLGAAVEEPTHAWQNPDVERRPGEPISRADTLVHGVEPVDVEPDAVLDEISAEQLLSEMPDDPDDIVGFLNKMATDDELEDVIDGEIMPDTRSADEPITKRGASAADMAEAEGALSWVEDLVDESVNVTEPSRGDALPDGENPLAWLEELEQEQSGVEKRLSEQARASEPPPITGPFSAERTQARQALQSDDPAAAAKQYQALLDNDADVDTVINDLLAALKAFPQAAPLHGALGDAYTRKGEAKRAAKAYRDELRYRDA